jgi:glycosyltransferase involved in cell wall biosynthesis
MLETQNNRGNDKLRILLASALPPPDYGGIINWTRVVRKEIGNRADLEIHYVDTAKKYRGIPGMQTLSRLIFGSSQALRVIWDLFRSMWVFKPHLLHLNTSGSFGILRDLIVLHMAIIFRIPTIVHYHLQKTPAEVTNRFYWKLLRWTMWLADAVVVLDKKSEALVRAVFPRKNVTVLPTMVEIDVIDELIRKLDAPPAAPGRAARIVFVGFVTPVKGVRELVEACLKLSDLSFTLDIVGYVPDETFKRELETIANQRGKADWLRFHSGVDHAAALEYILSADLLALPSHAESAPAVIIEAMGCGKPVVSTTTGAIPEMLDFGGPQQCGICVPPQDAEALADAVRRLIIDTDLRMRFAQIARERAEMFYSVPVGCKQLMDFWHIVTSPTP